MDDGSESRQDIPAFILNALKQLISLKSNITLIDDFHNDVKQINFNVNTDITDFTKKVKEFLESLQTKISDINNTLIKNCEIFIKEKGANDSITCKRNTNSENVNSDSASQQNETNSFSGDIVENSDSDEPLLNRNHKSSKQKKSENSDSDNNLKKTKTQKKRRKSVSTREISASDVEHEEHTDESNSKSSSAPKETEIDDSIKLNPKGKSELNIKENINSKTNTDSDKENTIAKSKVIVKEKHKKSEITGELNCDSEKEISGKENTENIDVAESNSETDSSIKKAKQNKKVEKETNKEKTKNSTDLDLEDDRESKRANDSDSTSDKTKITKNFKTEASKNRKKSKYITDSDSDTDKIKRGTVSDSDSNLEKHKSKSKDSKKRSKSKNVADLDSEDNDLQKTEESKKDNVSDSGSELEKIKLKTGHSKNKKETKNVKASDKHKSKKYVSDTDSELDKSKSNTDYSKNRRKYKNVIDSDLNSENATETGTPNKDAVSDDSDLEKRKSKSKKKSKTAGDSDVDNSNKINTDKSKTDARSDNDSELEKNKSEIDESKDKKKSKNTTDSDDSNKTKTDKSKKDIGTDSESELEKTKSKTARSKTRKISKNAKDSDSDNSNKTKTDKSKKDAGSDGDSELGKSKSKTDQSKNKKKSKLVIDAGSDSESELEKSKSKTDHLKNRKKSKNARDSDLDKSKKDAGSDSNSDLEESKFKTDHSNSKKKSKNVQNSDSDSEKNNITEKNTKESDSEKNKHKSDDSKENKNKSDSDTDTEISKDTNDVSKKDRTKKKNTRFSYENDSDSYIEDPRTLIENKEDSTEKISKSNKKSNESENLKDNAETNDNTEEKHISDKNITSSDTAELESLNRNNDSKKDGNESDNIENAVSTPNENPQQVKIENDDADNKLDDSNKEDTPKIGFIKCIDINKLLDPNAPIVNTLSKPESSVINKLSKHESSVINKLSKHESSVIILSSSESETESKSRKTRKQKSNIEKSSKKSERKETKLKNEEKEIEKIVCDSSSDDGKRRLRFRKKQEKISTKSFDRLRTLRGQRALRKQTIIKSSSDSDSDSSNSTIASRKLSSKNNNKRPKAEKISEIDPNYDYTKDIKFKSKCYISLPRIPVEKLKTLYLQEKEDAEIDRLTNMKSLKRTRQQKGSPSSSDNDAKTAKKRGKLQQRKKKTSDDEEQSEHSNDSMSDSPIIPDNRKEAKAPIPENLLDSDGDSNKHSDSSDDGDDKNKKKSKNGDKKKSDTKIDKEKEKDDAEENGKDKEELKEDKEKKKWRNDPLLRGKLSASDSDDELIRFRNKKDRIKEDIRSEPEEETLVSKKRKTKKQIKRIARRLGSDVSSSEDEKEQPDKSDSDKDKSVQSLSSDSEDETSKKKPVRRRIKRIKDTDESSDGEKQDKKEKKKKKDDDEEEQSTRKKIRHVWSKDTLADSTKEAAKEEEQRKKRIADRQKLYNEIYENKLNSNSEVDKVVLDFNEETKEELLSVHPELVKKLKPHQAKGVQFMWTACFESLERANNTEGSGCILAHCMGLGKTLQVITLIHTLLSNSETTNVKTVLVVCPLSTVLNWVSEFKKWLDDLDGEQVNVFDLVQYKQNYERLYQMQDWMKFGGVMVMGYDMFRNLSNPKGKRMSKKLVTGFNKVLLEPGPDLVICDEGHLLKNEKTGISIAMNRLKTLRRIVLTGTPLQNNLKEYFCMVQFVKPNLLGTYKEYLNRFVNPITNGQYTDSTPHDIQIMRKRAHVLHKMLDAVVERRDYNVLAPFLPPKHEYVLFVSLTPVQIELYREYLTKFSRNTNVKGTSYLFQDFQELQRICIHPRVLLDKSNQDRMRRDMEDDDSEGSLKDFINDDESDKSTSSSNGSSSESEDSDKKASASTRRTRANPGNIDEEPEPEITSRDEWWSKFCQGDELDNICHSSKIKLLFDILHQCELIGDKVLVFSQSLYSLNLIEYFLAKVDEATQSGDTESLEKVGGQTGSWALGLDYFRMDGSTSCDNRATWCKTFNNEANTRARLFLISTRAGGLGINLVAANRVIIFDVSWNPSFDIQSIYRVYRFGQTKPCYIYRFVTMGTMENKIYERQVTKQAISKRVIDEQQIDRHYNQTDLAELYAFIPIPDEERPTPLVPKDRLFADLLQSHDKHIFKYHEHNSLLEDKADEGLNEEERQAAWEEFENEKKAPKFNLMQTMVRNGMFETLRILVQEDNSGWSPAQINNILPAVVQRISEQVARGDYSMYRRVEERHEMRVMEQRRIQMIYTQYMQQLRSASGGAAMTPADMNKLAQMFSAYNQTLAAQQQIQPRPQMPGSSSVVSFNQGDPPPHMAPPTPHPAVSGVVELVD